MPTKTSDNHSSTAAAPGRFTTGSVTSKDGTTIGYRQLGHGPGIVVVHGAASSGYNHMQLAEALADVFTVYPLDRRGRGLSGPYNADYSIQQEIDDLDALLTHTGAHDVFGVSSGAMICLRAATTLPAIYKAAIYEPPFFVKEPLPTAALARFEQELAAGKIASALITGMRAAQMGPPIFNILPRWLLESLTGMLMRSEDKKGAGGYVPMREIAPTLRYDFQMVVEMNDQVESLRAVQAEVLLMGGSKSPAYLKGALGALEQVLPHVKRVELPDLDHAASWNSDRGGKPEPVAQALRRFFAES